MYQEFSNCFDEDLLNFYCDNCTDCSDFEGAQRNDWIETIRNLKYLNSYCRFMRLSTKG